MGSDVERAIIQIPRTVNRQLYSIAVLVALLVSRFVVVGNTTLGFNR
jgi:hypothetical protein